MLNEDELSVKSSDKNDVLYVFVTVNNKIAKTDKSVNLDVA